GAEAEPMTHETERLVEGMRVLALAVRRQYELVAALAAAQIERELHHRLADALTLSGWRDHDILDDCRGRTEMAEVVRYQQDETSDNNVRLFGDVERVVRIIMETLE